MSEQWKINDSMIADPDAPKLCVDCHWCDPDSPTDRSVSRYACHVVPDDTKPSLITGKVWATFSHTCEFMRGEHTKYDECERCGPEGRHWQAKRVCDTCAVKDCFASFRYLCCPDFKRTCDNCARELANGDKCDSTDGMMCGHWMMKGDTRRRDSYMWKAKASPTPIPEAFGPEHLKHLEETAKAVLEILTGPEKVKTYAIPAPLLRKLWNASYSSWRELEEFRPAGGF